MDRRAALLAWSLAVLSMALLVGGIALSRAASSTAPDLPFGGETNDASVVANLVTLLTFSVVGAIIASRHPRNTIGWLFCSVGVTIGLNSFAGDYAEFWLASGFGMSGLGETAAWFSSWAWVLLTYVPTSFVLLLFPDGRLPSPRWRPVAWGAALGIAGVVVGYALEAGPLEDFPQIANPYGVDSPIVGMVGVAGSVVAAGSLVASAISLIVRMRHAGSEQRQQIKWLAYGGTVVVGTICREWLDQSLERAGRHRGQQRRPARVADLHGHSHRQAPSLRYRPPHKPHSGLRFTYHDAGRSLRRRHRPIAAGLRRSHRPGGAAATRHSRLDPADRGSLRPSASGVSRRSWTGVSTARNTMPERRSSAFNARLRDETDLGALSDDLVGVVRETMQPAHVSLWLRPDMASEGRPRD